MEKRGEEDVGEESRVEWGMGWEREVRTKQKSSTNEREKRKQNFLEKKKT